MRCMRTVVRSRSLFVLDAEGRRVGGQLLTESSAVMGECCGTPPPSRSLVSSPSPSRPESQLGLNYADEHHVRAEQLAASYRNRAFHRVRPGLFWDPGHLLRVGFTRKEDVTIPELARL